MKIKETARVVSQEMISEGIYSLTLSVSFADQIRAGQFVSLFLNDRSRMLPRPLSLQRVTASMCWVRSATASRSMRPRESGFSLWEAASGFRRCS